MQQSFKVLIAEDSPSERIILESIVIAAGHKPTVVGDGVQAVKAFKKERHDIVLLDVMMPKKSGIEVAREIVSYSADDLVPILFLTSLSDSDSLVECLEAGGYDFVSKPYNRVVLQSKINAFGRMREMHTTLVAQKDVIELNNSRLIQEQEVAKQVFDKIAHSGCLDDPCIRHYMSPLAVFNGDVLVAEVSPSGNLIIFLGDFTGHGLPAAIGSMPLASIFYGMVRKGFSASEVLREINKKLHEILPVGFFCCATCFDISFSQRRVRVWNGGLPGAYIYKSASDSYQVIPSKHLPLGVLSPQNFVGETERLPLDFGDRIYMWSDGIIEARNGSGEMFGQERLEEIMNKSKGKDVLFDQILGHVQAHIGRTEKDDDLSLIEVMVEDKELGSQAEANQDRGQGKLADWSMEFELKESSLREFDPLPLVINIISEVPGLKLRSTAVYTVISELYNNALEHGILGLSSELKSTPTGFADYYNQRRIGLEQLEKASIRFVMHHEVLDQGGVLSIIMTDSGPGFDLPKAGKKVDAKAHKDEAAKTVGNVVGNTVAKPNYFGRGLQLIDSICEKLIVHPPGNKIEVEFRWLHED